MRGLHSDREVKLTIPAQAEYVDLVRLTLYGLATKIGFNYEDIEDMKVAISEACNNAVLYAYGNDGGTVEIVFEAGERELGMVVRDHGVSFHAEMKAKDPEAWHDKPLEDVQAGGLGFYLMQALMDEVEVVSLEGRGTEVRMRKSVSLCEETR
ncbi:anti-sigma B factor RsbW [Paenibacillus marinisediminis]